MITDREQIANLAILGRIERLLHDVGKTKTDLYANAGVTQGAYSQWKCGLTKPSAKSIRSIAKYLNTTEEYLLYGTEQPTMYGGLSKAQQELIDLIPLMTEQEISVLLATAKAQEAVRRNQGGQE